MVSLLAVFFSGGCGPPFPRELLEQVDRNVAFAALQKDPERYEGRLVMVGGVIVETKNLQEGTQFEVLQKPLDGQARPIETDETGGRFLVISPRFHDAAVFHRGRTITVVGSVTGKRVQTLGEIQYRYPVVQAKDVHLWHPHAGPRFSIGIGVYKGF
jgi:outer membrane lipoprotein